MENKSSKIEKILTEEDYKKAKKVVEKYKTQLRKEIEKEQKNCDHKSFYRYHYDDNDYINVCRGCFHEWAEREMPFLLADYSKLTRGEFEMTEQDIKNQKKYQARLEAIDKL